ncbi:hypothetical protein BH23ACT8_BH23ACT8_25420 [soil metagenome]
MATTGVELEQGDLIRDLPVPVVTSATGSVQEGFRLQAEVEIVDAVVLTQTCDLVQGKAGEVLLGRVVVWRDLVEAEWAAGNTMVKSARFIDNLIKGAVPPVSLLHARDRRPDWPWSVVDFRQLYTVRIDYLRRDLSRRGTAQRLRLRSPYKEHLAQAFARYFMRVGLPHDAAAFRTEGKQIAETATR